jgi:NADH-ubiquinone oxidoreductase chain 5
LPLIFTIAGVSLSFFVNTTTFFHLIFSKLWYTQNFNKTFRFLSNKWYFDVIYNKYINIPLLKISYSIIFKLIDKGILEIFGPFGLWKIIYWSSKQFNKVQTGFVYHYSFIILYSLILITIIFEI